MLRQHAGSPTQPTRTRTRIAPRRRLR